MNILDLIEQEEDNRWCQEEVTSRITFKEGITNGVDDGGMISPHHPQI